MKHSVTRILSVSACCVSMLATGPQTVLAQEFVPVDIQRDPANASRVVVSWPAIPGRTYEVLTRDSLDSPLLSTNGAPVKARSTIASAATTIQEDVAARFHQVRAQAVPRGNTNRITSTSVIELEKVLGLTFTPAQRSEVVSSLSSYRASYEAMRKIRLLNSDPPALVFDPRPPGFVMRTEQTPIRWSAPNHLNVPADRNELAFYTVRDLGELIRNRQITSTELTQLYLERIKRHDSKLKSVITLTEELALQQAARADEEIAAGNYRGPLHGIPYGLKDVFSTRHYRTTWGAAQFKDQVIDEDATIVKRLEAAGAVLMAKLSTGELEVGEEWFGGVTRNPWNLSEGASGSSSGPAAATSAGLVAFAIGEETYGSIILPSTRCRVTGLRPTFGRVSRTGAMALAWSMDKLGPICRAVEDCAIVLDAIRGADGVDRGAVDAPFNYAPDIDLKKLRIGYRRSVLGATVVNRLASIVGQDQLVETVLPSSPVDANAIIIQVEAAAAFDEMLRLGADNLLLPQSLWRNAFPLGQSVPAVEYLQANRHRQKFIEAMADFMEQIDVYVTTQAEVGVGGAPRGTLNMSGHPCVSIPHGGDTCLAFVGQLYDEATILALAKAYQDTTSFHARHPPAFLQ
ncbi:MAG: amidase [Verrucomicrobiia bacterium]